jgi:hypothetical protein
MQTINPRGCSTYVEPVTSFYKRSSNRYIITNRKTSLFANRGSLSNYTSILVSNYAAFHTAFGNHGTASNNAPLIAQSSPSNAKT